MLREYSFIKAIGSGSFGKVFLVKAEDGQQLAVKIITKEVTTDRKHNCHIMAERHVMTRIDHSFVIKMHKALQSESKLYFVMEYLSGGDLFNHIKKEGRFKENKAKFYACEIVLALEHLHKNGVIYRDLKPENVLIADDGHIKLTDFGLSKTGVMGWGLSFTFWGTPEYLAPEIILGRGHSKSVDWWTLGLLIYEMLSGSHPFKSRRKSHKEIFSEITDKPVEIPSGFSEEAADLITKLLKIEQSERLGNSSLDAKEIKSHKFFENVNWDEVLAKKILPPFLPWGESSYETRNTDNEFKFVSTDDTESEKNSNFVQDSFADFCFKNEKY